MQWLARLEERASVTGVVDSIILAEFFLTVTKLGRIVRVQAQVKFRVSV